MTLHQVTFVGLHPNIKELLKIIEIFCFKNSGQNQWGLLIKTNHIKMIRIAYKTESH